MINLHILLSNFSSFEVSLVEVGKYTGNYINSSKPVHVKEVQIKHHRSRHKVLLVVHYYNIETLIKLKI